LIGADAKKRHRAEQAARPEGADRDAEIADVAPHYVL
jgi:hypothetical protein